jgi:hypothetical protein
MASEEGGRKKARFTLGNLVATTAAAKNLAHDETLVAVARHLCGDWGDVCQDDWRANERALRHGGRLFSVYHTTAGVKFWVITEADRSITTVLLPDDY